MHEPAKLEDDMLRAVEALSHTVAFLQRYDRLQAALLVERDGGARSPLTACAEEGLAAAHRVLGALRASVPGATPREPAAPSSQLPPPGLHIPTQRRPRDRNSDPGE